MMIKMTQCWYIRNITYIQNKTTQPNATQRNATLHTCHYVGTLHAYYPAPVEFYLTGYPRLGRLLLVGTALRWAKLGLDTENRAPGSFVPKVRCGLQGVGLGHKNFSDGLIDFFLTFHKVAPSHRSMITTKAGKHVILPGVGRVPSLRIPKLTLSLSLWLALHWDITQYYASLHAILMYPLVI